MTKLVLDKNLLNQEKSIFIVYIPIPVLFEMGI